MEIQILGSTILLAIIIVGSAKIIESRIKFEVERSEEIIKRDIDLKVKNNLIDIKEEIKRLEQDFKHTEINRIYDEIALNVKLMEPFN